MMLVADHRNLERRERGGIWRSRKSWKRESRSSRSAFFLAWHGSWLLNSAPTRIFIHRRRRRDFRRKLKQAFLGTRGGSGRSTQTAVIKQSVPRPTNAKGVRQHAWHACRRARLMYLSAKGDRAHQSMPSKWNVFL